MLGSSERTALKLHDRADELLRDVGAPSAPVTEAVMEFMDALGDYDEDAGEVITPAAKSVLMFSVMRGYTLASQMPLDMPISDEHPGDCLITLLEDAFADAWFFDVAFPQGMKVWDRLSGPFTAVINAMLLDDQPEGPTWPHEVVDQTVRLGYIACCVDEWFDLRPAYREP